MSTRNAEDMDDKRFILQNDDSTPAVERENALPSPSTTDEKGLHHDTVAPEAIGGTEGDLPANYYLSARFLGTLIATCLAQISGYLGWVLPANTISLIVAELGGGSHSIWLAVSWQIGFTVGFLWIGRLSDIFGRRWFFMGSSILAVFGNILGSCAQSINMLSACNCINGLAAAGQLSFSVVLGELVSNRNRGIFNTIVLSTSVPFAVFGPPIMRAFFQHTALTFRWSYILGIIVNTIAVVLYFCFYHPPGYDLLHVGGKSKLQQLMSFDWFGMVLFTSGLTVFLIGLNWGGNVYSWSDAHVLRAFFAGIAGMVAFCVWEAYCPHEYPLMPMKLFRNLKYDAIVACAAIGAMVYYAGTVLWPTMAGALFTTSVIHVGWLSCAMGGGLLIGQISAGIGVRYLPRMKIQMTIGGIIMMAFIAAMASADPDSEGRTTAFLLIGAAGAGYVENLTLSTMALVWEADDIGLVAGVMGCIRTAAGALATSMYSSILTTELTKYLPKYVVPAAVEAGLPATSVPALLAGISSGSFDDVPGITENVLGAIADPIKHAYTLSFRTVFLCTIPFSAILLVAGAVYCPNVEDYMTEDVARKLQGVRPRSKSARPKTSAV
ncbi:MFS general substrate transporter [Lecanosticta acicola]|uniref:MFS general substrate transporter n=1 Tax=Lecanosticta acicola TaxID=111012 RepID=A0AAI9EEL1_9PEZI|nr:MFS general substrate transporter [Lecanosticta acicola]